MPLINRRPTTGGKWRRRQSGTPGGLTSIIQQYLQRQKGYQNNPYNEDKSPKMPPRKWWQYLPPFNQSYEDSLASWNTEYDKWALNDERRYNSPDEQGKRAEDAGYNRNLFYGQGDMGNVDQNAEATRPDDKSSENFQMLTQMLMQAINLKANVKNMNQVTEMNKIKTLNEGIKSGLMTTEQARKKIDLSLAEQTLNPKVAQEKLKQDVLEQTKKLNDQQLYNLKRQADNLDNDIEFKKWSRDNQEIFGITENAPWYVRWAFIMGKNAIQDGDMINFEEKKEETGEGALKQIIGNAQENMGIIGKYKLGKN